LERELPLLAELNTFRLLNYKLFRYFSIIILTFLSCFETGCQRNISPQAKSAISFFENHQYSLAVVEFSKLLQKYPKDPLYQYYLGASLVELNSSPSQANECLKAATLKNRNNKAWYYLGINYYRQFRFNEAKDAFTNFNKSATWTESRNLEIDKELERFTYASEFFTQAIPLSLNFKKSVIPDSIGNILNLLCDFRKNFSANSDFTDISGYKSKLNTGAYFYYSDQSKTTTRGKDIFRIQKISDNVWTDPQNLGVIINSTEDDDYPFFDNSSGTLYFASKGHESTGGFDIFKSKYDSIKNTWSKPEKLPFPINSPWDDYNWVEDDKSGCFVSNRENLTGTVTIYRVRKPISLTPMVVTGSNEMVQACMLKLHPEFIEKELPEVFISDHKKDTSLLSGNTPLDLITEALSIQKKCDSAILDAKRCKILLDNTTDKEKRAGIFSRIKQDEKYAIKMQASVNNIYTRIITTQKDNISYKKNISDSIKSEKFDFSIDDTAIYSDTNPIPENTKMPSGIVYRIQLGVFSKPVDYKLFGGIQPISIEFLQDKKIIKYYAGLFKYYIEADNSLNKVKEHGFKEAFIVAYFNNRKIPVERAKEVEKSQ
jgi:tetratricopeptide (TPR) repeat protein